MDYSKDPEEQARRVRESTEPLGEGPVRDTLADANAEAVSHAQILSDAFVNLDHIADNRGLYPDEVQSDIRETQEMVSDLQEWVEEFSEALKAEHQDVVDDS